MASNANDPVPVRMEGLEEGIARALAPMIDRLRHTMAGIGEKLGTTAPSFGGGGGGGAGTAASPRFMGIPIRNPALIPPPLPAGYTQPDPIDFNPPPTSRPPRGSKVGRGLFGRMFGRLTDPTKSPAKMFQGFSRFLGGGDKATFTGRMERLAMSGQRLGARGRGASALGGTAAAAGHFGRAATNPSETRAAGDAFAGAGAVAGGLVGGPVGAAISAIGLFGKAIADSIDKLQAWNHRLVEMNFQFAEYSGSMAAVQAQREVRQIQLSRERGERRASSAQYLAERSDRLDSALAPIQDLVGDIRNHVFGFFSEKIAALLEGVNSILARMRIILPTDQVNDAWNDDQWLIDDAARGDWAGVFGRGPQPANAPGGVWDNARDWAAAGWAAGGGLGAAVGGVAGAINDVRRFANRGR